MAKIKDVRYCKPTVFKQPGQFKLTEGFGPRFVRGVERKFSRLFSGPVTFSIMTHGVRVSDDAVGEMFEIDKAVFKENNQYSKEDFKNILGKPGRILMTFRHQGKLIAFQIGHDLGQSGNYYLVKNAVSEKFEKFGIGTLMMHTIIALLKEKGYSEISAHAPRESKQGMDLHKFYYGFHFFVDDVSNALIRTL